MSGRRDSRHREAARTAAERPAAAAVTPAAAGVTAAGAVSGHICAEEVAPAACVGVAAAVKADAALANSGRETCGELASWSSGDADEGWSSSSVGQREMLLALELPLLRDTEARRGFSPESSTLGQCRQRDDSRSRGSGMRLYASTARSHVPTYVRAMGSSKHSSTSRA